MSRIPYNFHQSITSLPVDTLPQVLIFHFEDNKIKEGWVAVDALTAIQQLGAVKATSSKATRKTLLCLSIHCINISICHRQGKG
jgi:hypothetical protein